MEVAGSSPAHATIRRTQQSFSFENILAHLVEHLSVKQSVVGSSPTNISFASSITLGSPVGRTTG